MRRASADLDLDGRFPFTQGCYRLPRLKGVGSSQAPLGGGNAPKLRSYSPMSGAAKRSSFSRNHRRRKHQAGDGDREASEASEWEYRGREEQLAFLSRNANHESEAKNTRSCLFKIPVPGGQFPNRQLACFFLQPFPVGKKYQTCKVLDPRSPAGSIFWYFMSTASSCKQKKREPRRLHTFQSHPPTITGTWQTKRVCDSKKRGEAESVRYATSRDGTNTSHVD